MSRYLNCYSGISVISVNQFTIHFHVFAHVCVFGCVWAHAPAHTQMRGANNYVVYFYYVVINGCLSSLTKTMIHKYHVFQIVKDCELLLVKKRLDESRFSRYGAAAASRDKQLTKAPNMRDISEATSKLPKKGTVQKQRETVSSEVVSITSLR